ncbi:MAG TPA: hypothetical protein VF273_10515, partial [Pelobium sp.]
LNSGFSLFIKKDQPKVKNSKVFEVHDVDFSIEPGFSAGFIKFNKLPLAESTQSVYNLFW